MFWRVASFNQTSPVEAVLDRPDFTLEDLLEEDDLIQVRIAGQMRLSDICSPRSSIHKCHQVCNQNAPACRSARRSTPGSLTFSSCQTRWPSSWSTSHNPPAWTPTTKGSSSTRSPLARWAELKTQQADMATEFADLAPPRSLSI